MLKSQWYNLLCLLSIAMVLIIWFKKQDLSAYYEGFSQDSHYIFKQGDEIYDDFYAEIYDQLMMPEKRCTFEIDKIIEMTAPSEKSSFLDIGSGTGEICGQLTKRGYNVYALDTSKYMIDYIEKNHPNVNTKCGNATEAISYEKGSFSHILVTGMSIYLFENKDEFLRNCFYWLKSGGYLILHLVDREKFDPIIPRGRPPLLKHPQKYASSRITDTNIDFIDFQYSGKYDFSQLDQNKVKFIETFTDDLTKNVRQQETQYYMEPMDNIIRHASQTGFIPHAQVNMEQGCDDEYQYLVILERTN
jgi:SAM-dependent methyltransferase